MAMILAPQEAWKRRLYLPAYQISAGARYAGASAQTVSYWHYRGGDLGPALPGREHKRPLSYLELVEIAFVATFRSLGVSLQRIRAAHAYLKAVFEKEYPFAQLQLKTQGVHLLLERDRIEPDAEIKKLLFIADAHGQMAWEPMVSDRFMQFDYEKDLALVWHVAGRQSEITIDPRISFGAPTIKGIATWSIKGRYEAGEPTSEIASDFALEIPDVQEALRFEGIPLPTQV